MISWVLIQNLLLANQARKGRRDSLSVLADEQMPMMLASSSQAVGLQTTLPQVNPPTSRIAPPWGEG